MKTLFFLSLIFLNSNVFALKQVKPCHAKTELYADEDFAVQVDKYTPKKKSVKNILIMPPTGGTTFVDVSYAKTFCRAGFNVQIVQAWSNDDKYDLKLSVHDKYYEKGQRAIGLVIKSIKAGEYIGMFGASLGGMHTALATNNYKEIKAAFIVASGASFAHIIAYTDEKICSEVRRLRFEKYGYKSQEEYLVELKKAIKVDPLLQSPNFHGKTLGMIIADKDEKVPTADQLLLRDHWKPKYESHIKAGHKSTILRAWAFRKSKILNFFKKSARIK